MNIPSEARGKCLKQIVDYTYCMNKAGVARTMFNKYLSSYQVLARMKSLGSTDATKKGIFYKIKCQLLECYLSGSDDEG